MRNISKALLLFVSVSMFNACAETDTLQRPRVRIYEPRYIDFTYKVDGKYQVKHSYMFGAGVKKCRYVGSLAKPYMEDGEALYPYQSPVMENFFEQNGHIYQGQVNKDSFVLGYPYTSRLGGPSAKAITGTSDVVVNKGRHFDPLCSGRIGEFEFGIRLHKNSSQTITQDIADVKKLMGSAYKSLSFWEPTIQVTHGENQWTVFKYWNKADYLGDAREIWYLSIGDNYYYSVSFTYKTSTLKNNPDQYAKGREMFNRILDSFSVRKLSEEEIASIVNPTPVEPKETREEQINRIGPLLQQRKQR